MIVVTAAILEDKNRIMIARRKANRHLAGYWEFPGGKIEQNETPEQCLIREIKEEFLVDIEVKEFVGESIFNYPGKEVKLLGYRCVIKSGELLPQDHDKIEWVTFQEITNFKMAPADIPLIEFYDQKRNH
jgi:mutator protein MutT|uniref:(deoxy)nucleoside triphosphate pyrophosphohydrolase n=1 Tax=Algoriphagus sp. TaxID=1872435 RepID=UPI004047CD9F